jgi:hypothetical protein
MATRKKLTKPQTKALRVKIIETLRGRALTIAKLRERLGLDRFTHAQVRRQLENLCDTGHLWQTGNRPHFYTVNPSPPVPKKKRPVFRRIHFNQHIQCTNGRNWSIARHGENVPLGATVIITDNGGRVVGRVPYYDKQRQEKIARIIQVNYRRQKEREQSR